MSNETRVMTSAEYFDHIEKHGSNDFRVIVCDDPKAALVKALDEILALREAWPWAAYDPPAPPTIDDVAVHDRRG
jgi:hypothetical protein